MNRGGSQQVGSRGSVQQQITARKHSERAAESWAIGAHEHTTPGRKGTGFDPRGVDLLMTSSLGGKGLVVRISTPRGKGFDHTMSLLMNDVLSKSEAAFDKSGC